MDVILGLSLIRPGPASSGMKERFVRRRRGLEPPECLHPALRTVLADTYGVMLYQEDVLRVAHAAAGLTLAEADRLRKDLGKGPDSPRVDEWRERFVRGAVAAGARREDALTLWQRVSRFAAYSYCKAHACTYGEISYRAVYLRARWPAEFAAAVLANQAGYYERRTYLEDARRRGVPILGPDVNASAVEPSTEWVGPPQAGGMVTLLRDHAPRDASAQTCEPCAAMAPSAQGATGCLQPVSSNGAHGLASKPWHPTKKVALRVGLMDVRGLSERAMRETAASRASGGPYGSVADLAARIKLSREELENLALAGALDSLAGNRPRALWQVHAITKRSAAPQPGGMVTLLRDHDSPYAAPDSPLCPDLADYSPLQKLLIEDHVLGMTPSASPMAVYRPLMIADCELRIADLTANSKDRNPHPSRVCRIAGVLFAERRARTRTGEFMKFLSLEDETGVIEAVLLPDAYQRLGGRLQARGPYVVTGTVEDHLGARSLLVADLVRFQPAARPQAVAAARRPL